MSLYSVLRAAALALTLGFNGASAKSSVVERKGALRSSSSTALFQSELRNAMSEALGCGGHIEKQQLAAIEEALGKMWPTFPKNSKGRIEHRSLRYMVHRYFHQKFALLIRGFEPSRPANASGWGTDDILSQRVPAYVEGVLESKHAQEQGFDLRDAVYMVATIEELIFDSESALLEQVYHQQHIPVETSLTELGMEQVLEEYMVRWMLGGDEEGVKIVLKNMSLVKQIIPHWNNVVSFARGRAKALQFRRQQNPRATSRPGHNALSPRYSFDDAHQVIGGITKSFASFWDSECASMKTALVEMDTHNTGRVPLSKFYGSALKDAEWRFGESESYLRELGALDETSSWVGKQVIIPNYLQAASNCVVAQSHYLVCCMNECDSIVSEIETRINKEAAKPSEILALVGNMTSQTTVDHDDPAHLDASLKAQLEQIAANNGGTVPLHGRLFAQWLHYVFPRECPFPHKAGTVSTLTPTEFGESFIATKGEMHSAISTTDLEPAAGIAKEDLQWMSQWSPEEELFTGQALPAPARQRFSRVAAAGLVFVLLCSLRGFAGFGGKAPGSGLLPTHAKSHFV